MYNNVLLAIHVSVYKTFLLLYYYRAIVFNFCAAVKLPVYEEMCSGRTCNTDG